MLTETAILTEHRPDLPATCPARTAGAAEETSEALRAWAVWMASGATEARLALHRERTACAVRRFRASAERRA
ncbi:hypothetical protein ACFYRD_14265 [Streptomyces hirsutus]|uniref:hypothetical protein n=1 Tax=Streptomyces hirsutus TaxID=35620 RepID=UPI0036805793